MDANDLTTVGGQVELVRQMLWLGKKHFLLNTAKLEKIGLGSGQLSVLLALERHGEMNQRALAEHVRVTPATVSGTLKRMERAGYIQRTADENDARVSLVRLTEEGEAQCAVAKRLFDETCCQMLEGMTQEDLTQLKRLLTRIQDNLGGGKDCRGESCKKE